MTSVIRAKRDKPPVIRKAHGKLWQLFTHLKSFGHEIDWINCSSWINYCEVVEWEMDNDAATWMEPDMSKRTLVIDVAAANVAVTCAQSS